MTDDILLEYAFNTLPPAERAVVDEHLQTHPADAAKVALARRVLRPLEAVREPELPPKGLALAALGRTAEYVVTNRIPPAELADEPVVPKAPVRTRSAPDFVGSGWRRIDLVVAAGIAFIAFGIVVAGIGKIRQRNQVLACQENLRGLHSDLVGYTDTHDGRFPQVGTPAVPVAGAYSDELARNGHYPSACPAARAESSSAHPAYAYSLGYLGAGSQVVGLRRGDGPDAVTDGMPIAADLPPNRTGATAHANGQNVLYAGGSVRYATTPTVGVNGDDIYHNDAGLFRAGLHRDDASLGRPADYP